MIEPKLFKHLIKLPDEYRSIVFCLYKGVRSYSASTACGLSVYKYLRMKELLLKHMECYRVYLHDKRLIEKFLKGLTAHQYKVFKDMLENPFRTSEMVAKSYHVGSSAIRVLFSTIFKVFEKSKTEKKVRVFIVKYKKILFGRRKI